MPRSTYCVLFIYRHNFKKTTETYMWGFCPPSWGRTVIIWRMWYVQRSHTLHIILLYLCKKYMRKGTMIRFKEYKAVSENKTLAPNHMSVVSEQACIWPSSIWFWSILTLCSISILDCCNSNIETTAHAFQYPSGRCCFKMPLTIPSSCGLSGYYVSIFLCWSVCEHT